MTTTTYSISGMTCEHCAMSVREEVSEVSGVSTVDVEHDTGRLTVAGDSYDDTAVGAAVTEAGYEVIS